MSTSQRNDIAYTPFRSADAVPLVGMSPLPIIGLAAAMLVACSSTPASAPTSVAADDHGWPRVSMGLHPPPPGFTPGTGSPRHDRQRVRPATALLPRRREVRIPRNPDHSPRHEEYQNQFWFPDPATLRMLEPVGQYSMRVDRGYACHWWSEWRNFRRFTWFWTRIAVFRRRPEHGRQL